MATAAIGASSVNADAAFWVGSCGATEVPGFQPRCFVDARGRQHQVYVTGAGGPPVLLLHELPGLVDDDLRAARRIADLGYTVVAPLFFGEAGARASVLRTLINTGRYCDERHFACASGQTTSVHVRWLLELARAVRTEFWDGKGLAAVGMCLTGAFPLALLQDPSVAAAVLCQPTIPFNDFSRVGWFTDRSALGIHPDDLEKAKKDSGALILGLRYTGDWRCPPDRFRRLTHEFGSRFHRMDIAGNHHSTLASSFCPQAFREVAGFLNRTLRETPDPAIPFGTLARNNSLDEVIVRGCEDSHHG